MGTDNCNDCGKMDLKDKAVKKLIESFENKLHTIEGIACKNRSNPNVQAKRKILLSAFEDYLKELLIC